MATTIGIDIGGTFVDVVVLLEDGKVERYKFSSTPNAPAQGVLFGLEKLCDSEGGAVSAMDVVRVAHGSTVATNALLEGQWACTGLVTTQGFRDVLEIGRQNRSSLYDLNVNRPQPIVPRDLRLEVRERVASDGTVLTALDEASLDAVVRAFRDRGVESVAVCLLFAYAAPAHERRIGDVLRSSLEGVSVTLSSQLLPEFREYERTSTTVTNAALVPRVHDYLEELHARSRRMGIRCPWQIMQSSGAVTSVSRASEQPARLLLSGPAGGVEGAMRIGRVTGIEDLIAFDMGGTSCDVSLVRGGKAAYTTEAAIGGYRVALPMVDIHTIGAGGGSIAWVDDGGSLRIGPQSAGADPGPACYGAGGIEPTVTDAHLVLGHLHPEHPLGGLSRLDVESAVTSVNRLAHRLDLSTERTALGILEVADAAMEGAIRVISVERGHDPREFAIVAFGGAGPLHAGSLADRLGVERVIIPSMAGVLSAYGLLVGKTGYDLSQGIVAPLDICGQRLTAEASRLLSEARKRLLEDDPDCRRMWFEVLGDLRYSGQAHELSLQLVGGMEEDVRAKLPELAARAERGFHEAHRDRYGYDALERSIEVVSLRVRALASGEETLKEGSAFLSREAIDGLPIQERTELPTVANGTAWFGTDHGPIRMDTPFVERSGVPRDRRMAGPVVLLSDDATTVVPPGWEAVEDGGGNLVLLRCDGGGKEIRE